MQTLFEKLAGFNLLLSIASNWDYPRLEMSFELKSAFFATCCRKEPADCSASRIDAFVFLEMSSFKTLHIFHCTSMGSQQHTRQRTDVNRRS